MNLSIKKMSKKLALLAVCVSVASISIQESTAATLTIEYEVNIQSFTNYVSNTTTSYESPLRHGSISFSLASPVSYETTAPVVAADPGRATTTIFPYPVTFTSPIPDLIDASYYAQQFGNTWGTAQVTRTHRVSDNSWDSFTARLSSTSSVGMVSSGYSQILSLVRPFGDAVAAGSDPYAVSADALVDYFLDAWRSGASLGFSEGFSVYDILQLRYVDGINYRGSGQVTNVLVDNVSMGNSVPEPSTLLLCALGIVMLGRRSLTARPRVGRRV